MPDARLDLSAKRVNCHGFYTGFGTKPFSKEGCLITQKEVNAVFDGQVALCREILQKKTKEYTGGDTDRLGAFKAAAALQHTTPERALAGMLAKHIVSLYDMCFADGMSFDAGTWDEKITDSLAGYVFPRSSMAVKGLVCELPPVDSGYRGEIHAILSNVSSQTRHIPKGSRIGQLVITPVVIADFVTELGEQRGTGAFGSTGK